MAHAHAGAGDTDLVKGASGLQAAKALGLTIPPAVLARADEIIE